MCIYGVGNAAPGKHSAMAMLPHATAASGGPNHHIPGRHIAVLAATHATYVTGPAEAYASMRRRRRKRNMFCVGAC